MKKILLLIQLLVLSSFMMSCHTNILKDSDLDYTDDASAFTNYHKENLNQIYLANETEIENAFSFTVEQYWNADVDIITGNLGDPWISLDKTSGEYGDVNLTIKMTLNYSQEDRIAKINIYSEDSKLTLDIVQTATIEGGGMLERPTVITTIIKESSTNLREEYLFRYNDYKQLTSLQHIISYIDANGLPVNQAQNYILTHEHNLIKEERVDDSGVIFGSLYHEWHDFDRIERGRHHQLDQDQYFDYYLGYNEYNQLTSIGGSESVSMHWTGGNISELSADFSNTTISNTTISYTNLENKTNIDLNFILFQSTESLSALDGDGTIFIPSLIRMVGESSANLISDFNATGMIFEDMSSYEYEEAGRYEYELDSDEYLTRVEQTISFTRTNTMDNTSILEEHYYIYTISYDK